MATRRLAWVFVLGACGPSEQVASSSFGTSITTAPASTSTSATTGGSTSSSGSTTTTSAGPEDSTAGAESSTTLILDVGAKDDVESPQPAGCQGKIDFLFVISRLGTLQSAQAKLVAAFPEFIETIEAKFADFDYHIMVVDADTPNRWGSLDCTEQCPVLDADCAGYPCDYAPTACDKTLGAGTIFNAGWYAPNEPCAVTNGRRYIETGQPNLIETFTCMAQVGTSGTDWQAANLVAAISPELNGPGGCNEGFLRDDALLMVTIIGPPDEGGGGLSSPGWSTEWAKAVRAAKHGDNNSVVMLRICDASCPVYDQACILAKNFFPYHHLESLEVAAYGPAFDEATDLIEVACSAFIPG